jgi:CHAT domain-containing protein/tetratricopeptide (TPR) repeat protein
VAEARALTWLGLTAWRKGDYRTARRLGEDALALKQRLARQADLFKSYNALGLLAWNEGRLADATRLFGLAASAAQAAGDRKGIASASGNLALVETELGDFEAARHGFDSMLVAGRAVGDPRIEGNALTNLGMLAVRVGDPGSAVPLLDSARARYRAANYPTGEQNALGQLGTAYAALGRPGAALAALDSALELSRRQGLRQDEASNLEAMAELYRDAGDQSRALDLYARAEPINQELGLTVEAGTDLRSIAEIRAGLGAPDVARTAAHKALAAHRAAGARLEELTDLLLLARLTGEAGQADESKRWLADARILADGLRVDRAVARVAIVEAQLADRAGEGRNVLRVLALAHAQVQSPGSGLEPEALRLEARAWARAGRLDSAAAVGRRAVAALERVRGGFESGELRTSYLTARQGAYADLADVLRRLGRTEQAFEVADAARGRALVDGLATLPRRAGGAGGPTLRQADDLLRTIAELNQRIRDAESQTADPSDSGTRAKTTFLRRRLAQTRSVYEEVAIRLRETGASPAAAMLGAAQPSADAVLTRLRADEALLEYQPAGDSLVIFVGRSGRLRALAVPLPRGGLASRVRLTRALISDRGQGGKEAGPALRGLADLLVTPARHAGLLAGVRDLVIVPHGVLAYLPFAALIDASGRYLAEDFGVLTLPAASALAALRGRTAAAWADAAPVVLAPDPVGLPGTEAEATAVARAVPGASVRIGREASEATVRQALAAGSLVHLASHGELNARNPMFSWLQTAGVSGPERGFDGRLEVHEILDLRIQSPLVFLSGCETAVGSAGSTSFAPGEDFATVARAFLYAGARNVVATLWRVDDEGAAAFAAEYYRRLATDGPVDALAGAQRTLARDRRFSAPYYWAGYTLAGDGQSAVPAKGVRLSVNR